MHFTPTRAAGLDQLEAFIPYAGRAYAASRNHDNGPERKNVSQLSPWLHAGLLGEREVIASTLDAHSPEAAEKFIAEVFWRVYFKGYCEQRPTIWPAFCEQRTSALASLESNAGVAKAYAEAVDGRTGIAAFDYWARELVETGYLHNHARMWFASIWIFTLKLDWTLGADFFLRHLIDGDAASNTLSWRWVGGLHTAGKTYLAHADNITRYTEHHPDGPLAAEGLSDDDTPLTEAQEHARQALELPGPDPVFDGKTSYALLLHDEGASHAILDLPSPPAIVIGAARPDARSPNGASDIVRSFAQGAVQSGLAEASAAFDCPARQWDADTALSEILDEANVEQVVTPYLPVGWTRDALWPSIENLSASGRLTQLLPDLQRETWPHARAGFFRVKKAIPDVLGNIGLAAG